MPAKLPLPWCFFELILALSNRELTKPSHNSPRQRNCVNKEQLSKEELTMPEEPKAEYAVESADQADAEPLDGWRIIAFSPGGQDLHDCVILEVARGHYKFLDPHFNTLAESIIFPPIFEDVELGEPKQKFTVSVRTNLIDDPQFAFGNWSNPDTPEGASGGGDWTAQSGIGPLAAKAASADAS
jgi:hypothetical protein